MDLIFIGVLCLVVGIVSYFTGKIRGNQDGQALGMAEGYARAKALFQVKKAIVIEEKKPVKKVAKKTAKKKVVKKTK